MRSRSGGSAGPRLLLGALLAGLTLWVYAQVGGHPFIGLDDTRDITGNRWVRAGLTAEGVRWAFANDHPPYLHPLTWISHMVDVSLFGTDAGAHLLVNVALHLAGAALLLAALGRMTGAWWPSGLVALLFALHPLHVESVAWAAERKDVLSGVFWMLALAAYAAHARRPGPRRLVLVLALFAGGLLAKPVVITLPAALLLLDAWPLGRWPAVGRGALAAEKLPLLLAALPIGALTWLGVRRTTFAERAFPLGERLANALVSTVVYLRQTLWPADLAVFYPHPASVGAAIPAWQWGGALALLAAITAAAVRLRRTRPWLLAGWLWYLVTLAPVLGVVQNWEQARADRFTYLPLVGLFVAAAWEADALARRGPALRRGVALGAAAAVLALSIAARRQVARWESPETLFRHALAVTGENWLASAQLGVVLLRQGRYDEAEERLRASLRQRPLSPTTHSNLGALLERTGRGEEAAREYAEAIRQDPGAADALVNLGTLRFRQGQAEEAEALYRRALAADPGHAAARYDLELALRARAAAGR